MKPVKEYQTRFIDFAIRNKVLQFGRFTLKSGRSSPYFFNSGLFNNGDSIGLLGSVLQACHRRRRSSIRYVVRTGL